MMHYKANHDHLSSVMCRINDFREDSSFCDIVLMINNQRLQAHKCVLAGGSPYFNSLLNGQFAEAKMKEVNLSKVTTNFTALETVVNFIYTGEIDIEEDNLEVTIKLSSFFMIESLKLICCSFMTDNLSLATCLRYYFYSRDNGFTTMEKKTWHLVRSRFHDYLIYEDATQVISADEMEHLVERNVLQHCSDVSIVRFIALWVNNGLTEGHVLIAKTIFQDVMQRDISPEICLIHLANELSENSLYKMIESSLRAETTCFEIKSKNMFLDSFKQVLKKLSLENEKHIFEMSSNLHAGKETAIITVCPSQGSVDYTEKAKDNIGQEYYSHFPNDYLRTTDPMLYVCAYVPRTRCWYKLQTIYFRNKFSKSLDSVISQHDKVCGFYALHDELVVTRIQTTDIIVNDLNTLENQQDEMGIDYNFLRPYFFRLVAGKNNSRYAVILHTDIRYYFAGYKLHNDGKTWQEQFKTKVFDLAVRGGSNHLYAKISIVSNEMLVVCSTANVIVFVVDLNEDNSSPVILLSTDDLNRTTHMNILEATDAMYIVTGGTEVDTRRSCTHTNKVRVIYEYKLCTKQLERINSTEVSLGELDTTRNDVFPCLSHGSTSFGEALWYMEGNDDKASFLTKVSVDGNKNPVVEHHTPPPFPIVTALVAGRISSQILENKKPITRYLGNE